VTNDPYDVFVSYSRADRLHAADIDSVLRAKGLKPFFDSRNLPPGLPWLRALEQAIGAAKAVIVLIGANGFGNTQQYERDLALYRQTREPTFPVIPVILPEAASDRPFDFLQILTWIDFSHVTKVSDAPDELEHLLTAVRGGSPDVVREAICPYRGLDAFREEDSAFFFGRGSASDPATPIGELVQKVRTHPFVMVVGRSGSGKSSLIFAGLLPALRRERDRFWNILCLRPGPAPLRALAAAFNPPADNEGTAEYAAKISSEADNLRKGDPELLSHMIRRELDEAEGKPDRLLLYIDQWEELYAQAPSSSARERADRHTADVNRFIDLLLNAAGSGPVTVVATVRADFYDPLIRHQGMQAVLPVRQVLLGSMSCSELERTIVEPAKKVGLAFDPPSLVHSILDDAGEDEGMLPLLQYALKETWALRKGNIMTADSYARSGGVREAIRITAERTFEALSPEDQKAARQLFLRLVTPGEGQVDTRARAAMPTEEPLRRIVEQFAGPRTRLLVTGSDRAERPMVDVAHEALIRTWPRLRTWVDANREKLRSRAAIVQAKAEWEQHGRREDLLLPSGFQLERGRALLAEPGDIATDDIQEFVDFSSEREQTELKQREAALAHEEARVVEIKAGQARTARWQWIARWAFVAVGAVIVIAAGIVAILQAREGRQLAMEQASNAVLKSSLDRRQLELDHARANILAELSGTKLLRGDPNSALRLASRGTRIDLALPSGVIDASPSGTALAAAMLQANWRLSLGGHEGSVSSATFSPEGSRVVTASRDRTARIWDAATAKQIAVLRGHDGFVLSAAFSPDGSRIVTSSDDKTARIWDAATAKQIAVLRGHNGRVNSAAFSPDGSRIVTASDDNTARTWDGATAKESAFLGGHKGSVLSAAFSPDGSRIVTASDDNTARIWDAATAKGVAVLGGHEDAVSSAAFSPDGTRIVTASDDKTARLWDAATAKEIAILRSQEGPVYSALFSPDGARIVTAFDDNTARIWDAATAKEIGVLRGHDRLVNSASFSPNGRRIVTASGDNTARIWDAATKEIAVLHGHKEPVSSAAFSPDGLRILTASHDNTARIWEATTLKEIAVLHGHNGRLYSAAFSPDGSRIVTASSDKTARIWDAATAKEIAVLRGHDRLVYTAAFSPDGSRVITASADNTGRIWDAANAKEIAVLRSDEGPMYSAAFSPDGSRVVTASWDTARIWDVATAKETAVLRGHDRSVNSAAFSPDGSRVVTASDDYTAGIWDAATAKQIAVLRGHDRSVNSAAFSPDGSRVVTASLDNTARIWDVTTTKEIAVLHGHDGMVYSAAFSPDGSRIVTASDDSTARIWSALLQTVSVKDLLLAACARLAGVTKLTRDEMRLMHLAGYPDNTREIDVCND
jgi:WD40 repeat protein/energy-coupling factor transporter ATP-binding protein EcfA2